MASVNSPYKKPLKIYAQNIQFLGEQDGQPERLLKKMLIDLFYMDRVIRRAYLVRASLNEKKEANVVLALRGAFHPNMEIVNKVGEIFGFVFNGKQHLDIMFLSSDQEAQLIGVCKPFFEAAPRPGTEAV